MTYQRYVGKINITYFIANANMCTCVYIFDGFANNLLDIHNKTIWISLIVLRLWKLI